MADLPTKYGVIISGQPGIEMTAFVSRIVENISFGGGQSEFKGEPFFA